ncbi:putative phospholipid ABC transporter permease protein MlaE [Planctomycetes bacterium Pan216]|uniref:Putative phospholipid ABC transporter permease protein MlaE n=1 Tax=Kolteria novifilia TaxID=2527975 RepID=A0A518BBY8_9BACT|nr:putative phospholipid ABC transporter permease protein MlaE [Planctomycetes bacterium Pan216]
MVAFFDTIGRFSEFAGQVLWALPGLARRPALVARQLVHVIAGTAGLIAFVGASLGLVTWMHLATILGQFDSEALLPSLLMLAVVVEVGPALVGVIAAGRLGSGLAAELAAMQTGEQVDALRCLGFDPIKRLVAPRVAACLIALPLFTILIDYAALLGSYFAEASSGRLTWSQYAHASLDLLGPIEAILAVAKTAVFGLFVGWIGCWLGLNAERSTTAIGQAATRAVVWSTLAVLAGNVVLVRLIQWISGNIP